MQTTKLRRLNNQNRLIREAALILLQQVAATVLMCPTEQDV